MIVLPHKRVKMRYNRRSRIVGQSANGNPAMMRYLRAFWKALVITLRGERVPRPYGPLRDWMEASAEQVRAVFAAADEHAMPRHVREKQVIKLEGRLMSMQTILEAVQHHVEREYPHLLREGAAHNITAIYASNMDDQYRVMRLRDDLPKDSPLRKFINDLSQQLNAIPPSNSL